MPVILDSSIPESTRTGVIVLQVLYGLFFIMGISKPKFYRKLSTNVASYFSRSVNTDNFYSYSIQDACHMYFLIDHPLRSLCGSAVEHRSAESEGLIPHEDTTSRHENFSLSHAREKTKNIFLWCTLLTIFSLHRMYC